MEVSAPLKNGLARNVHRLFCCFQAQPSDGDTLSELSRLDSAGCDAGADAADWEREAEKLFEWTQELSFDDLALTPRLDTTYPS